MGAPDDAMEGLQAPFVATHGTLEPFEVPRVVYGTYKRKKDAVIEPLRLALTAGFTAVDTAFVYNNEAAVGKVLADRPDVIVTTKLWRSHYSPLLLSHPDLLFLSASLSRSPARILLDWAAAHRLVPVVSSAQPQHLAELMAPPQPLPPDAMALLDSMEERHGTHVLGWTNADSDLDAVDVPNPAVGDKWTN